MKNVIAMTMAAAIIGMAGMSFTKGKTADAAGHGSSITWVGKKVTGQHSGTIDFKSVDMKFDKSGVLTAANFEVDMTSIKCTDLEGDKAGKLEGHLKSDDFFGVESHPVASFSSTMVEHKGDGQYMIKGDLTIKGKSNPIEFRSQVSSHNGHTTAKAELVVNRTLYDVKYGSGSFFDGLGDNMIYDDFNLNINVHTH